MPRFTVSSNKGKGRPRRSEAGGAREARELLAAREIAQAFLTADSPAQVFDIALERVTPLVGAAFSSVYVVDGDSELMRLAAAHNWPERFRPWLGEMRVRLGFGPSGAAAKERRTIEVPDVFADPALEDWQEVATELGFRALTALPLQTGRGVLGALAFYYGGANAFDADKRALVQLVADQLAAAAEKAALIEELRRANTALTRANAELARQNEALIEARRVKDEFLANISHELRTPLTAVLGYIGILQEEISGPLTPHQRTDLEQVTRASERLLELIDDLLELTTLKRGGAALTVEEFDPREALRAAAALLPPPPAGLCFRLEAPPDALPMRSDRKRIIKILVGLMRNAFKFTPAGEVIAAVATDDARARFSVRDTGIGIAPEAHAVVFEEFRQVDGSATRRFGGSGLGLALARRLARVLGGDLTVESAPGRGSTFTLDVPLVTGDGPAVSDDVVR